MIEIFDPVGKYQGRIVPLAIIDRGKVLADSWGFVHAEHGGKLTSLARTIGPLAELHERACTLVAP